MKDALVNHLWLATSRRAARAFHVAAQDVAETQAHLLKKYLTQNRETVFGQSHNFASLDYSRVPLTNYDDYFPYIDRVTAGEQNILTTEPVQMFELSSGSTAASKMIPYTATLKSEFQRGISAWINNLFTHHAELKSGPAYWSISPLTEGHRQTRGGIPIGFEEDSAYLGPLGVWIESALAVPNLVKHIPDVTAFRYVTLLFLLRCENLRLISVWNPTFLTLLLAPLSTWWESLLKDIRHGTLTPPASLDENIHQLLQRKLSRDPRRARALASLRPDDYESIWPKLSLISCWADGASESYARELQRKFPNILLQPKGLLATEAFVSFPLFGRTGGVLAITSHYFEFLTESGDILPAHQLGKGSAYSVVITTGGGLYRYQLNDIVEVTDFYGQIPCLRFTGKADRVSDYFGEKLNEQFVANVLAQLFEKYGLSPAFAMLAPEEAGDFHYTLYVETSSLPSSLVMDLDTALRANFHYDYCRKLGQLAETQVSLIARGTETYLRACQARGQKLGDIKPAILQKATGWGEWFSTLSPLVSVVSSETPHESTR